MADLPTLAALYLPSEDDYGIAVYDADRGRWLLVEARVIGDVGEDRVKDLIPASFRDAACRCNQATSRRDRAHRRGDPAFCQDTIAPVFLAPAG